MFVYINMFSKCLTIGIGRCSLEKNRIVQTQQSGRTSMVIPHYWLGSVVLPVPQEQACLPRCRGPEIMFNFSPIDSSYYL